MTTATARDYSLNSGERQVAKSFADVRADHRARYIWAGRRLGLSIGSLVLDVFSGTGYGAKYIAQATGASVLAVDGSKEAIRFAEQHYASPIVRHVHAPWPTFQIEAGAFDAAISFESLEHIEDHRRFAAELTACLKPHGRFFLSVPCESVIPCRTFGNQFHVRHYELADVVELFPDLSLIEWFGQSREGTITPRTVDRTLLVDLARAA